jgi:hypothetical protein
MADTTKEIIAKNTVDIHGKQYLTVAGRVQLAHEEAKLSIDTECIDNKENFIVFKATVTTEKGVFTGWSMVDLRTATNIEKGSPLEVAETSAVGRALGFAGFGAVDSIASADEMVKAGVTPADAARSTAAILANAAAKRSQPITDSTQYTCEKCGEPADYKVGTSKTGNPYRGIFCSVDRDHVTWLKPGDPTPTPRVVTEANKQPEGLTEDDDRLAHGDEPSTEPTAEEINADIPF